MKYKDIKKLLSQYGNVKDNRDYNSGSISVFYAYDYNDGYEDSITWSIEETKTCCGVYELGEISLEYNKTKKEVGLLLTAAMLAYVLEEHSQLNKAKKAYKAIILYSNSVDDCQYIDEAVKKYCPEYKLVNTSKNAAYGNNIIKIYIGNIIKHVERPRKPKPAVVKKAVVKKRISKTNSKSNKIKFKPINVTI